jgi:hypothetical protein
MSKIISINRHGSDDAVYLYKKITTRVCHKIYTLYAFIQTSQKGISTKQYQ